MKQTKPPLAGALMLREFIDRTDKTAYAFSKRTGIMCDHLLKVLRGDRRRISVDLALDIQLGTNGEVPVAAWRMRPPSVLLQDVRPVRTEWSEGNGAAAPA